MGKTKRILKGKWPEEVLTQDQQVRIANRAGQLLVDRGGVEDPEAVMDEINNLSLWLGGVHPDIQVYAWQFIRRKLGIDVYADDKTAVRLRPLEEKIFREEPYQADTYQAINHYPWPKEWLDGSTFEDRLETLAEEVEPEEFGTADMILNGIDVPSLESFQIFEIVNDVAEKVLELKDKHGPNHFLFLEKMDNALSWINGLQPDYALYAAQLMFSDHQVSFNPEGLKNWEQFSSNIGMIYFKS